MIAVRESLIKLSPGVATFQNNLGHGLNNLALFYEGRGRFDEALAVYRRGSDVMQRAFRAHPHNGTLAGNLDWSLSSTARMLENLGHVSEAESQFDRSLAFFAGLPAEDRDDHPAQSSTANLLVELGLLHFRHGNLIAALDDFERSRSLGERLLASQPKDVCDSH